MPERHVRKAQRPLIYGFLLVAAFATAAASAYGLGRHPPGRPSAVQR